MLLHEVKLINHERERVTDLVNNSSPQAEVVSWVGWENTCCGGWARHRQLTPTEHLDGICKHLQTWRSAGSMLLSERNPTPAAGTWKPLVLLFVSELYGWSGSGGGGGVLTVVLQPHCGCGQQGSEHLEEGVERQFDPWTPAQNAQAQGDRGVQVSTLKQTQLMMFKVSNRIFISVFFSFFLHNNL